jgi:hypothetical protein
MPTIAERKVVELQSQIAAIKAAEQSKKMPIAELTAAETALNETIRLQNINQMRLAEASSTLGNLHRRSNLTMGPERNKLEAQARFKTDEMRELESEAEKLEQSLRTSQHALGSIEERIAQHPDYHAVRKTQRELVAQACQVAEQIRDTPLRDFESVFEEISKLAAAEESALLYAGPKFRAEGLPEIKPMLRLFLNLIYPVDIINGLPYFRASISKEKNKIQDLAARAVVR